MRKLTVWSLICVMLLGMMCPVMVWAEADPMAKAKTLTVFID